MIKIVSIVGARPQIIKSSAISRAIKNSFSDQISEIIVHTGQHYDDKMSKTFFNELNIPNPKYNLNVGSANHGQQTAAMIKGIENMLIIEKPDCVILYGDTNSTLAGAISASKLQIPIAHVEAGLRSFNKTMPEEINRILCDHVSTLLFCPTKISVNNLVAEGFKHEEYSKSTASINNPIVYYCGDIMYDNSIHFASVASENILKVNNITSDNFILVTVHRNNNTDDPKRLSSIFNALNNISRQDNINILIPLHPRTSKLLNTINSEIYTSISKNSLVKIIPPVSFLEMIALEKNAKLIITDSGGVQKEAYFFKKPSIVLRPETEWVELVENKVAILADADEERIIKAYRDFKKSKQLFFPIIYGDGHAAEFICSKIIENFAL